ncbi:cytochrome c oxidase assembly protein [Pseudomonas sp. CDFA 602]|uniref:cytochrome c oxidase assembly protein n=1 Tax=Pseudomonas californiensis TaxID=2829823 RepID=UPI001E5A1A19|nr:cytochrome c oxidase assembly protein [Pseudomonas californiensis]MCD5992037.1 cytochrome c oxidase assembly protein [Pseudomonas californiensis]MCD5997645.1 cytochrome c oxidase assembly protein [Pseudomonas californiensis]
MSKRRVSTGNVVRLLAVAAVMFGCGLALMPLYQSLRSAVGLSGHGVEQTLQPVDESRQVRVQFVSANAAGMTWTFYPKAEHVDVHPGATTEMLFVAQNPTDNNMKAQAVPGISPSQAGAYFHKTECFCFTQQTLRPGERIEMPVRFIVDRDLPRDVTHLTLSYTLFDITVRETSADRPVLKSGG